MNCNNCQNQLSKGAKFCNKCGQEVGKLVISDSNIESTVATVSTVGNGTIIKCGNCGNIGDAEDARNPLITALAWLCVVFAPLITIIYFVGTHKYRCPKCKSTFLGVKNKEGIFVGQRGGAGRPVFVFLVILLAIAIIGILSSVVLASLNSARAKAKAAAQKGYTLEELQAMGAQPVDNQ